MSPKSNVEVPVRRGGGNMTMYGGWKSLGYLCRLSRSFNVVNQVLMGVGYVSASLCEANDKQPFPPGSQVNTQLDMIC